MKLLEKGRTKRILNLKYYFVSCRQYDLLLHVVFQTIKSIENNLLFDSQSLFHQNKYKLQITDI